MFLKTIADAKLLSTANELFVLRDAPAPVCLSLAKTMVDYLTADVHNEDITLLSKEHAQFVIQIIGPAFKLPIHSTSAEVIFSAIDLYQKWMNLATAPAPIQQFSQFFTKKMCQQLSLVFQSRRLSPNSNEFAIHVRLCQNVLAIFSKSARAPPHKMTETKWNEFLCRIFLGICDEVMKVERAFPLITFCKIYSKRNPCT